MQSGSNKQQGNASWQRLEGAGNLYPYDILVQQYLEKCFQQGMLSVDLEHDFPHQPYEINFTDMTQTRKSTGRIRQIVRLSPSTCRMETVRSSDDGIQMETMMLPIGGSTSGNFENSEPVKSLRRSCRLKHLPIEENTDSANTDETPLSLIKHLSSLKEVVTSFVTNRKRRTKPKKKVKVSSAVGSVLPHPPFISSECKMAVQNVKSPNEIMQLPAHQIGSVSAEEALSSFAEQVEDLPQDGCSICCDKFDKLDDISRLQKCQHVFHKPCLTAMYECGLKTGFLECPICKTAYGIKIGNQPPGDMDYYSIPCSLPGYSDCNTICIIYRILPGIQTVGHPHPGQPYRSRGFPRCCYLPDNEKGRQVLKLLILAWERRLTFTIGTSVTTGENDTVTWNEIHHKTEFGSNYSGHGYPDPQYLDNVTMELALQGIHTDII